MSDLRLNIDWALTPPPAQSVTLAQSGCYFSRIAVTLSRDLALLKESGLASMTDDFIATLWRTYANFIDTNAARSHAAARVHNHTCQFLVNQVVARCEIIYHDDEGIVRSLLQTEFPRLAQYQREAPPSAGSSSDSEAEEIANV